MLQPESQYLEAHIVSWIADAVLHHRVTPESVQAWLDHVDEAEEYRLCSQE